jgi:hypothetical protein
VFDNHLIDGALLGGSRILVVERRDQLVSLSPNRGQPGAQGDADAVLGERLEVDGIVGAADFRREDALRGDVLQPRVDARATSSPARLRDGTAPAPNRSRRAHDGVENDTKPT